jgi:hypothetical protein
MEKKALKLWILIISIALSFLCSGCIGPHYTEHELIVDGKQPPAITGPRDPVIKANLTTNLWTKAPFAGRAAEVGATLAKSAGIQGWKDYHMRARATGIAVQHEFASNGFLTMDLQLQSLTVDRKRIPLHGTKYMRVEIFLGKVSVEKPVYQETNPVVIAQGKFVWDSDGWFEIHPQETGDVALAPPVEHKWYLWFL